MQPHSLEALQARIRAEILANPPLLYEPEEAAEKAAAEAAQEAEAAASKPQLFDAVVQLDPQVLTMVQFSAGAWWFTRYTSRKLGLCVGSCHSTACSHPP